MASMIFNACIRFVMRGVINFDTDQFGVVLLTNEYQPDKSHTFRSDLTDEVVGEGYKAGGATVDVTMLESEDNAIDISLDGYRWLNATITARYAAYFRRNGGYASDDELVALIDFGRAHDI